jgi:DNA ligase (NAD+)
MISRLKKAGLQFESTSGFEMTSQILAGKTIVASGKLQHFSREGIKDCIEQNGGKAASSVSKKTDYLLAGENTGPNKLAKANELEIPIITELEFLNMIHKN